MLEVVALAGGVTLMLVLLVGGMLLGVAALSPEDEELADADELAEKAEPVSRTARPA